ncbi:MAG: DNA translocase FtsK 4TM domain-containing protein [Bacteroidales bacterium]|nr:DNA translocase FtsK 4TM domain-containing protein [Bacteroidales bacterium]
MPKNTLKQVAQKAAEPKEQKDKKEKKNRQSKTDNDDLKEPNVGRLEKVAQVVGIFSLLASFFFLVTFISYLFNWFNGGTDDIFSNISFSRVFSDKSLETHNLGGRLGAALSTLMIKQGFGIGTFFLVIWMFILGVRLSLKHIIIPLGKSFGIAVLMMVWLSVALAFLLKGTPASILGGISGFETSIWLEGLMGKMGLSLLLVFVLVAFLVVVYNFSLHAFKQRIIDRKSALEDAGSDDATLNNQKNSVSPDFPVDKYNTVEFAVKDESIHDKETKQTEKNQPSNERHIDFEPVTVATTKQAPASKVEFTVEPVNNPPFTPVTPATPLLKIDEPEEEAETNDTPEHHTIDTPYDPTLDLGTYQLPGIDLLDEYGGGSINVNKEELEANKNRIVSTLGNYGIQIDKIKATIGPTVTLYEIIPAPGVRISKIKNLEDDIALSLSALGIRIIAPIPGKGTIGIEVPNQKPEIVGMKTIMGSEKFSNTRFDLPFAIGKTIANEDFIADLTKMPHILMAGATGQGKSVGLNAIIASLLYKKHPAELKFVMVDPKKVELTLFSKIERHYLAKLPDSEEAIITDTRKVVRTLNSLNIEMDQRYDLLKDAQVRNIKEYNIKYIARKLNPEQGHRFLPYIVVVIDEFADLILTAGKEVEHPITRLAQLARAIGIHLVIATQRPSVNIITGTIKANFPARIAFRVISKIDSRTILDTGGADQLIGRGDLLMSQGGDIIRLQCAFIDTHEIERITEFIGSQRGYPSAYALPEFNEEDTVPMEDMDPNERDELFEEAAYLIVASQQGSTSLIQRKLKLGYNRAGRIIDQLEAAGIVGPFEGSKAREVRIATEFALEQYLKDIRSKENHNEF